MKFKIEQVAIYPPDPAQARTLLEELGMEEWVVDRAEAVGTVFGSVAKNTGRLQYNYSALTEAREFEVLSYDKGPNWMDLRANADPHRASHFGMHCSERELKEWRAFFTARDIGVAQEVSTTSHQNPAIAGKRWYHYVIFDTHSILGIDLKFIVRHDQPIV